MRFTYWIVFAGSLVVLLAAIGYCWRNGSGHSGVNPMITVPIFAPVFVFGLVGGLLSKRRCLAAGLTEVTGFVGMVFGVFVSKLGILNQYEDWIAAGMPERNPYAALLLVGFAIGGLGGSLVVAFLMTERSANKTPL